METNLLNGLLHRVPDFRIKFRCPLFLMTRVGLFCWVGPL